MATEKDFKVKNGLQVGNGLINATSGDVSLRRGGSTTNRIRIASANIYADTNLTVAGNLEVSGNFNITGDINQTSVTTLDVTDKTITVANNAGSAANANNAGLIVDTGGTLPSLLYTSAGDNWNFNKDLSIAGVADAKLEITSNSGGDPTIVFNALQANRSALFQYLDNGSNVGGYYKYSHAADEHQFGSATATNINLKIGDFKTTVFSANSASSDWVNRGLVSSVQINAANRTFSGLVMDDTGSGDGAAIGFRYDGTGYKLELATAPSSGGTLSTHLTIDRLGAITTSGHLDVGNELTVLGTTILKNSGVVTIKAAPLGSTYGAGFNAITVTGTSSSPYTSTIGFSNYGETNAMVIKGANVGIGTTNPDAKLSVTSTTINSEDIVYLKSGADNVNDYLGIAWELGIGGNGPHAAIRVAGGPSASDARLGLFTTSDGGSTLTEGLSVAHNGNVGINNTDPDQKLSVNGVISSDENQDFYGAWLQGNSSSNGYSTVAVGEWYSSGLYLQKKTGEAFSHMYSYAPTYPIAIAAGSGSHGETALTDGQGKVGIGTTGPTAKLHVVDNDSDSYVAIFKQTHASNLGTVQIDTPSDSNARPSRLDFARGGVNKWKTGMVYGDTSNGWGLSDATGSGTAVQQTRFLVQPGGNVGIGTTSPSANLEVENSSGATIMVDDTNGRFIKIRSANSGAQNANISSYSGLYLGGSDNASHLLIDNSGNVAIGVSSASARLDVRGGSGAGTLTHAVFTGTTNRGAEIRTRSDVSGGQNSGCAEFNSADSEGTGGDIALSSNGNIRMFIEGAGKVGIGTASPQHDLVVHNDSGPFIALIGDGYNDEMGIIFNGGDLANASTAGNTGAKITSQLSVNGGQVLGDLRFITNSGDTFVDSMYIDTDGKVGIGTNNPATELDIAGGYLKTNGIRFGAADKWKIRANSANEEIVFEYANSTTISDSNVKAKFHGNNFGIGSSMVSNTPESRIHIKDGDAGSSYGTDGADKLIIEDNDSVAIDLRTPSANQGLLMFSDGTRGVGSIGYAHTNDQLNFKTGGAARFEIDSNGKLHAIYGFSRGAPFPHYYHKRSAQLQAGSSSIKKARIGRIYWTSGHWSAGGVTLLARVGSEYYSGENRVYYFSAQYTDAEVSYQLLESHSKHSNNTRIYLGTPTTSHTYSGQPCKYQDIWVEANSYKRIHVDFTSLGKSSGQQIYSSNITSGWGGVVIYDSLQDAADVASFTDELINKDADHFIATSDKVNDTLNQGEYFGFNQLQSGTSLNFNLSTYQYKVPITGVYLFGANIYRNSSVGGNISFRKTDSAGNNGDIFARQPQTQPSGDTVIHLGQMKLCNKGDLVGVYNYGATFSNFYGNSDDNYSSFYGHLIKSTM